MDRDVEKMLAVLEPAIDEKCTEIKRNRKEKTQQSIFAIVSIMLLIIPSLLVFIGVNVIYFLIIASIVISVVIFTTLPLVIKIESRGVCYE